MSDKAERPPKPPAKEPKPDGPPASPPRPDPMTPQTHGIDREPGTMTMDD